MKVPYTTHLPHPIITIKEGVDSTLIILWHTKQWLLHSHTPHQYNRGRGFDSHYTVAFHPHGRGRGFDSQHVGITQIISLPNPTIRTEGVDSTLIHISKQRKEGVDSTLIHNWLHTTYNNVQRAWIRLSCKVLCHITRPLTYTIYALLCPSKIIYNIRREDYLHELYIWKGVTLSAAVLIIIFIYLFFSVASCYTVCTIIFIVQKGVLIYTIAISVYVLWLHVTLCIWILH
jgi:hypothetical protein